MYSWEVLDGLYAGSSVSYELLDGLKEKYSYAKTIFRNAELQAGLAINFINNIVIGVDVRYSDSQEAIEAKDVNLLDVELRNYRGDNYFVGRRGSTVTSKIQKHGFTFGSQLFWDDGEKLSIGLQTNYTPSDSKILKPFSTTTTSFDEVEDSYAAFEFFDLQLKTQYKYDNDFTLGAYAGYFDDYSWSKISPKELLIWEWDIKKTVIGFGSSYQLSSSLIIGLEYEFSHSAVDSSKYIDNLHLNIKSNDHTIRCGAEYKIAEEIFLRGGVNYGFKEYDLIYGGTDCNIYKYTAGVGFPLLDILTIDANLQYTNISPAKPRNSSRSYLSGNISLVLRTF
jgi:opacity protein-like surface antigen